MRHCPQAVDECDCVREVPRLQIVVGGELFVAGGPGFGKRWDGRRTAGGVSLSPNLIQLVLQGLRIQEIVLDQNHEVDEVTDASHRESTWWSAARY